ncbi:acetyl-CoA synthetase-like protein [Mycena maculata]|uniref:Acetyl-CoA synthetase-like protein n=1 Tax=Mycena maculata TaxID=230809 RepID=A0AAD7NBY2_9AGAR|nr:acetyl-CoA synthetase-like protein [Mycena maculata]
MLKHALSIHTEAAATMQTTQDAPPTHPFIHDYFEKIVQGTPTAAALQFQNDVCLSYAELDRQSNLLADHLIREFAVEKGTLVLMFFDKCIEMVVALLAIIKAGGVYIPLDIDHPAARTQTIQALTGSKICLTSSRFAIKSRLAPEVRVLQVDRHIDALPADAACPPPSIISTGEDLCYILFTSGSSGVPKGVLVSHKSIIASVINGPKAYQEFRRKRGLKTFFFSNYAFDLSVWDVFITLTSGGCLCMAPKQAMLSDLNETLRSMDVTFLQSTPTVLSLVSPAAVPTLATVFSGGEPLTTAVRDKFLVAGTTMYTGYGPSEACVASTFSQVDITHDLRAVGRPFGANRIYILDENLDLSPVGAVGRMWIGGPQVAVGYLGQPDLTARAYLPDKFAAGGRMYDTGDLCSWAPDGQVLFHGRADGQVKIRGQRIETNEIEIALRHIVDCVDVSIIKRARSEELLAFVISRDHNATIDVEFVKRSLSTTLPIYMIPTSIVAVLALPVNPNGKLDRVALEALAPSCDNICDPAVLEKMTSVEKAMYDVWATEMPVPTLDIDFFACGGDSITAIRIVAKYRSLGYPLDLMDLYMAPTIKKQVAVLARKQNTPDVASTQCGMEYRPFELLQSELHKASIIREVVSFGYEADAVEDAYPCTAYISGLISLATVDKQSHMAHYVFEQAGAFDPKRMEAAWRSVIAKYAILRTIAIVAPRPYDEIVHVVLAARDAGVAWSYSAFTDNASRDAAIQVHVKAHPGFSMNVVPTRVALFTGPHSSVLTLELHQSQCDGWSLPLILADVHSAYSTSHFAESRESTPYSHFVRWVRDQDSQASVQYWNTLVQGAPPCLWPSTSRSSHTTETLIRTYTDGRRIVDHCAASRVTMSTFIRTAVALVLRMYSDSDDVTFGVVVSGRTGDLDGLNTTVGSCISTYPCRVQLKQNATVRALLAEVHKQSIESIPHQCVGLAEIQGSQKLFNVLLTIENLPGLHKTEHPFLGRLHQGHHLSVNYPLAITVYTSSDRAELRLHVGFDSAVLSLSDVGFFVDHLSAAFNRMLAEPEQSSLWDNTSLLTAEEGAFLRDIAGPAPSSDPTPPVQFFHTIVDDMAAKYPTQVAIEQLHGASVNYATMVSKANQAAHGLQARHIGPNVMVPILFDKNQNQIETVVSILAVMKAGGVFCTLDVGVPTSRLKSCIQQTSASFIICQPSLSVCAFELSTSVLTLEDICVGQPDTAPPTPLLHGHSLSACLFTSGSTGQPKGVLIEHSNLSAYLTNIRDIERYQEHKRFLHFSPWTFDRGLADLLLAFSCAGTLILVNMDEMLADIDSVLNETRAEHAMLTPAIAQLMDSEVEHPHLRDVVIGGDKVSAQLSGRWRKKVRLIESYGPTEASIHFTSVCRSDDPEAPAGVVGRPLGSTRVYVVDSAMKLLPVGAVGELCVAGAQVTRGYLGLPEQTAAAFVPDIFYPQERMYKTGDLVRWRDGSIQFLRRRDGDFIKFRGMRIDPTEIETVLSGSGDTHAVVQTLAFLGEDHLVATLSKSLAPQGQPTLLDDVHSLRPWIVALTEQCRQSLPGYAVPTLWLIINAMPQSVNNKIDRRQVRRVIEAVMADDPSQVQRMNDNLTAGGEAPRPPQTTLETIICGIWEHVLSRKVASVDADFFSVGGDSISSVRVLAALRHHGWMIAYQDFYAAPTIARLASLIDQQATAMASNPDGIVIQLQRGLVRDRPPIWWIHDGTGGISPSYALLDPLGPDVYGISNPATERADLAARYPSVDAFCERYMPLVPESPTVVLAGWSSGGKIALSFAAQRRAAGFPVKGVVLLDSYNTEGSSRFEPPADMNLPPLQDMQLRYMNTLGPSYLEPHCVVPVLLIKAERSLLPTPSEAAAREAHSRNKWTVRNLPLLEIVVVPNSDHASLMFNADHRRVVSGLIRDWCAKL